MKRKKPSEDADRDLAAGWDWLRKLPSEAAADRLPVVLAEYECNAASGESELTWREYEGELAAKVIRGARQDGVTLTAAECEIIAEKLKGRWAKREPGRPKDDAWALIGLYCLYREAQGDPVEAAVAFTKEEFKVSRATVYEARRRLLSR